MRLRGRYLILAWTALFLAVAGTIAVRDRRAFGTARRVAALEDSLNVVSRLHGELAAELANLQSPGALTLLGERLGLRAPTDSELLTVTVTGP